MPDDRTVGEIARSLEGFRKDVANRFDNLDRRLDTFVSAQVHASDLRRLDQRIDALLADIDELKAAKRWAIGIAIAAVSVLVGVVAVIGDLL